MSATDQTTTCDETLARRLEPALREALTRTMTEICGDAPEILDAAPPWDGDGITSVIPYEGTTHFVLAVSLPQETAVALCRTFTGVPIGWETEMMQDVVGELVNVLAGDVAAELATHQLDVQMSLPGVERSMSFDQIAPNCTILVDLALRGDDGAYRVAMLAKRTGGGA